MSRIFTLRARCRAAGCEAGGGFRSWLPCRRRVAGAGRCFVARQSAAGTPGAGSTAVKAFLPALGCVFAINIDSCWRNASKGWRAIGPDKLSFSDAFFTLRSGGACPSQSTPWGQPFDRLTLRPFAKLRTGQAQGARIFLRYCHSGHWEGCSGVVPPQWAVRRRGAVAPQKSLCRPTNCRIFLHLLARASPSA